MRKIHWATVTRRTLLLGILGPMLAAISPASAEQKIYWSETIYAPRIQKSNVDGSNVETVFEQSVTASLIMNMELDTTAGKIYWTDSKRKAIMRANRDGSNAEVLISGLTLAQGLALDLSNAKIYFTGGVTGSIERSNLDGTGREVVHAEIRGPREIALDVAGGKMYWGESSGLGRANLDGTGAEVILSWYRPLNPDSISLDLINGHIYFYGDSALMRVNLDGTGLHALPNVANPYRMEIDAAAGKIYWTGVITSSTWPHSEYGVKRANLDLTVIETLLSYAYTTSEACGITKQQPLGFALDLASGKLVTSVNRVFGALYVGSIQQANLDGTDLETLLPFPEVVLCNPRGIAIDQGAGKIYWAEATRGIGRANLDGTGFETVNTDSRPNDVAVDPRDGEIYWAGPTSSSGDGWIRKANGDGSNVETFGPWRAQAAGITLDLVNDKVYWADGSGDYYPTGFGIMHRMNLDGSQQETLEPTKGLSPKAVAVDPVAGKMYFGRDKNQGAGTVSIYRGDLDGSNLAPVLDEGFATSMYDLALDASGAQLYLATDRGVGRINLPGGGIEILHDIQSFSGIALADDSPADGDGDGVPDSTDLCPDVYDPDQGDNDSDGFGDLCDEDDDNDTVLDSSDNCQFVANPDQLNSDGFGAGDACNDDFDGDEWDDSVDICPNDFDPYQTDTDEDGLGDACDVNDDDDAWVDVDDNCPVIFQLDQADLDSDEIGDACDSDLDGDGVANADDNCPTTYPGSGDQTDTDTDGLGDVCDDDDDNDTVPDGADNCPLAANPSQYDADDDGIGDVCNDADDADGDEWSDTLDNCPAVANGNQADLDGDLIGDACDPDDDGDGVADETDSCAATPIGDVIDPGNGCSIEQLIPCEGMRGTTTPWKNHGKFVSAMAHAANDFLDKGLITDAEKDAIMSAAGASLCGRK